MLNIIVDGVNSDSISGLVICSLPPITKPPMRVETTQIDGRDGSIVEELGYSSYTKSVQIGLRGNYDIDSVIQYFNGLQTIIFSNESSKVYNACLYEQIDFAKLVRFKKATVRLLVQPYKFSSTDSTVTIQNGGSITNNGNVESKPIIRLKGQGAITFSIGSEQIFTYDFHSSGTDSYVYLDCEKEEAYLNSVLKNRNMSGNFPKLPVGTSTINIGGTGSVTSIQFTKKDRWI